MLAAFAVMSVLVLGSGSRSRVATLPATVEAASPGSQPSFAPARLVALETGLRLAANEPPSGWSHLVVKSMPRLASGDLDTVSENGHIIAQRIRPVIAATVRRLSDKADSLYRLDRVGVGLCAPAAEGEQDVIVSPTVVGGTRGSWTTKERVILSAMALETSRARLVAATATFAFVRTPVLFLVDGKHRKIDVCYAIFANPRTGGLRALVWRDIPALANSGAASVLARLISSPVYSCPMDVHATRLPGNFPVARSFAVSELPPGKDMELPPDLLPRLRAQEPAPGSAEELERDCLSLVDDHAASAPALSAAGGAIAP